MPLEGEQRKESWLLWAAGALGAPAFLVPMILIVLGMVHYYKGARPLLPISDGTMIAVYVMVQVLGAKPETRWIWWLPCAAVTITFATLFWLRAFQDTLFSAMAGFILAGLISTAPPVHRWRQRRRRTRQQA